MDKTISLWTKIKASWRGLKQIRRLNEWNDLHEQNKALQFEVKQLQASLNDLKQRAETEWGPLDGTCPGPSDDFYYAFEETYRGSRELVKNRLSFYLPYVETTREVTGPNGFLDIGCGRGEWIETLKENKITAHGIDLNAHMIHETRSRGLDTEQSDILPYLRKQPDETLTGISGFHIVEHLPLTVLTATLSEAWRTLAPGGVLILETPNPENFTVGACNFYVDPTHRRPIPPPTLAFMIYRAGFKEYECLRVSTPDFIEKTTEPPTQGYLKTLEHHITVGLDYSLIAYKPKK
jgi:O-antigen chain-terminating methyltransferase